MNELQTFNNKQFGQVRTLIENNKVLFCASDVAKALGYTNVSKAINDHCKGITKRYTLTEGGKQQLNFIPEGDVYRLIIRSKLPNAEKFERWVFDEVLPEINRTGRYSAVTLPDFTNPVEAARAWADEVEAKQKAQAQIEADKPKVLFADSVSASKNSISVADMAKVLKQNGIDTGQHRFYAYLRNNNYLISRKGIDYNSPTQYAMNLGLFEIKETAINTNHGIEVRKTPRVTGKGQIYFVDKFKKELLQ